MVKDTGRRGNIGQVIKSHICPINELRHYPEGNAKPRTDLKQRSNMMQMHITKLTAEGLTGGSKRGSQERMMTA